MRLPSIVLVRDSSIERGALRMSSEGRMGVMGWGKGCTMEGDGYC